MEMLAETVILSVLIRDKIIKVLYEVSSIPVDATVIKEMKAAIGVHVYISDAKVANIAVFHLISRTSCLKEITNSIFLILRLIC